MVSIDGLTKSCGRLTAVADVSLSIRQGEVLALIGPNGSGKTPGGRCFFPSIRSKMRPASAISVDGRGGVGYTLGTTPGPGRNGAAPNPDLFPENNPIIRPPVAGRIGLWAKTDSTSHFEGYLVSPK
jgi:hypothetical protein